MEPAFQIMNDPVHGSIQLHPLLVKIIDTPQFQRLRDIKQLGVCYWVYPGASHNRFEHCIGVSYLCGQMIDTLEALHPDHPDLVKPHESLCIKIAGLCRDLGYGPFSHFFHEILIPKLQESHKSKPQRSSSTGNIKTKSNLTTKWARDASCKMFDFMLKENKELKTAFDNALKPKSAECQVFIKDLIRGKEPTNINETCSFNDSKDVKKAFLYEIVSNLRNRIDCNKFDYIARDCHNVGFESGFNWQRYLQNIRIMELDGQLQIFVRDKEALNLYELFHARWRLYHQVYRHKTKACIEDILASAFLNAEFKLEISELLTDDGLLSEADEALERFTTLTDRTLYDEILGFKKKSQQPQEGSKLSQDLEQLRQPQLKLKQSQQESIKQSAHDQESKQSEEELKQPQLETKKPDEESKQLEEESKQLEEKSKQAKEESRQAEEVSKRPEQESKQSQEELKKSEETSKHLQKAKELLLNIQQRKLYKFCGYAELKNPQHKYPCRQEKEEGHKCPHEMEIAKEIASKSNKNVGQEQILVSIVYFHYGKEDKNPIDNVQFFNKSLEFQKFNTQQISYMLPKKFDERFIRVYAKAQKNIVQSCFKEWCVEHKEELECYGLYDDQSGGTQVTHQ